MCTIFGKMQFCWIRFALSLVVCEVVCGSLVEDRLCGTLFSGNNLNENTFMMKDWDHSVNLRKDYRTSIDGWGNTGSARVELNCTLSICSGNYFQGNCRSLPQGNHEISAFFSPIASANCTCAKCKCKCEEVIIQKNEIIAGRAYIQNDCNSCQFNYILLRYNNVEWNFPSEYSGSVKSIVIRSGCNLTIYSEQGLNGSTRVITTNIAQDFQGRLGSYQFSCDDDAFVRPPRPASYPPLVELPSTASQLFTLLSSDDTLSAHPGLRAALQSAENGRSSKNAYILFIGEISPGLIDLYGCQDAYHQIGECHISIDLDMMGVSNAQLRVIYAAIALGDPTEDATWTASMENYLSKHEELSDAIPNAVVVWHDPMNDPMIAQRESQFQRKLAVVNALRGRILDEKYSNLVFLLWSLGDLAPSLQQNPSTRLAEFESAIEKYWTFPKPVLIAPADSFSYFDPQTSGHWKHSEGKYLLENLLLLSQKGGDPLGNAIIKASFPSIEQQSTVTLSNRTGKLLPATHAKVQLFKQLLTSSSLFPNIYDVFKTTLELRKLSFAEEGTGATTTTAVLPSTSVATESSSTLPTIYTKDELKNEIRELKSQFRELREKLASSEDKHERAEARTYQVEALLMEQIRGLKEDHEKIQDGIREMQWSIVKPLQ